MNTPAPIDAATLAQLRPQIVSALGRFIQSGGALSAAAALDAVFRQLFGNARSRREQVLFMVFAATIARRIAVELADGQMRFGTTDVSFADLRECLHWLDSFDPLCARMLDLRYVAGLGIKDTAAALQLAPLAVVRDLRFTKSWVQTKL